MKTLSTHIYLLLLMSLCGSQMRAQTAEAHNFTTYDTVFTIKYQYSSSSYALRITRPVNSDTASRPAIIMMNGIGEIGSNSNLTATYGPHYWLQHGWDGGITLGNGTHYPILVTVQSYNAWPGTSELLLVLQHILKTYHIKKNSVHLTGLSMGAFSWSALICHQSTPGGEDGMKLVKSLACLEGQSQTVSPEVAANELPNYNSFGHWAKKYNGKFFGLEGTQDYRNVGAVTGNMNDSMPGSAYFSYETLGGGSHCCWNNMYDPSVTNWTSVGTLAPNLSTGSSPNSMGTYKAPSSIFQWLLRQGDTTMVGSTPVNTPLTANAGANQTVAMPTSTATLNGGLSLGSIASYSWSLVSGPNKPVITNASAVTTTVTGLITGTYVFALKITSILGLSVTSQTTITVNAAANAAPVANAGADQSITLPTNSVTLAGAGTDADGNVAGYAWSYVSGPTTYTLSSTSVAGPGLSNLVQGTYVFKLTVTDDKGAISTDNVSIVVNAAAASLPAGKTVPGKFDAEAYDGTQGTQNQSTTDAGGGQNVGWITYGSWLSYNVTVVTAGTYTVNFRVATPTTGCTFQVRSQNGTVLATVAVPNTGGYQTWQTASASVTLAAGAQSLSIFSTSYSYWNINWIEFVKPSGTTTPDQPTSAGKVIPGKIEGEDYDSTMGTQTQGTSDTGGGLNVGWITTGSWMSYNVTVAAAGTYTASFRVATGNTNTGFLLKNGAGATLATVKLVNSTGGYQTWQTLTTTVVLPAGTQTIWIQSTSAAYWNFNWMSFASATGTTQSLATASTSSSAQLTTDTASADGVGKASVKIYPNPAKDNVSIDIVNSFAGKMTVSIIDQGGRVVKTYSLVKDQPYSHVDVASGDLRSGTYFVRIQIGGRSQTFKLVKI